MFFLRETRGVGLGRRLLLLLLDEARTWDYKKCYLETLDRMWQANELYQKNGFQLLEKPMGTTGHGSCDRWYLLHL
jgi:putative acetyltransferase